MHAGGGRRWSEQTSRVYPDARLYSADVVDGEKMNGEAGRVPCLCCRSRYPHVPDPTGRSLFITFSSKGGAVLLCWLLVMLGLQESSSVHLRGFTLQPEPPNPPSWR